MSERAENEQRAMQTARKIVTNLFQTDVWLLKSDYTRNQAKHYAAKMLGKPYIEVDIQTAQRNHLSFWVCR